MNSPEANRSVAFSVLVQHMSSSHTRAGRLLAAIAVCLLASLPVQAQSVEWFQRANTGPSPREYFAMTYDAVRGVTVLFGGSSGNGGLGDTWEWNGSAWAQRSVSGPSPRTAHAMTYDNMRGVTVLFGGALSNTPNGETWEWNGTAWNQRMVSGPSPRYFHAMAYDSTRGVTVLFGGWHGSGYSGETWEWNGSAWTQRAVSGPSPRSVHAMAYDAGRGATVLFGGAGSGSYSGETWEWSGTVWTQRFVTGPSARTSHTMAYDTARGVTVLFGGRYLNKNHQFDNNGETWDWDGNGWSQQVVSGPSPRSNHSMTYDAGRAATVLFGGSENAGLRGDTWELVANAPPASLSVTPTSGLVSSGDRGGTFSPSLQIYTLTNNGGESLTWTATKTESWVTLSEPSGTLAPGESTTLTVSINTSANPLTLGNYNDTVTISNTSNGLGNTTRPVMLSVTSPCESDPQLRMVLVSSKSNDSVIAYDADSGLVARRFSLSGNGVDYPNGIIADRSGNFYVASVGTDSVLKFDGLTGTLLLQFSGGGLNDPDGILLHESTPGIPTLLVSSFSTNSVKQYNLETALWIRDFVQPSAGVPGAMLAGPAGLAHSVYGNLLVSSQNSNQVLEFDAATGDFVDVAAEGCGLNGPEGLLLMPDGSLLVASFVGRNVLRFVPGGSCYEFIPVGSGGLDGPSSLALGSNGNVLVAGRYSHNLLEFNPENGSFVRVYAGSGGLGEPTHIMVAHWCNPDCNSNGMIDRWDLDAGRSADVNHNGIPDECGECIGDIAGNGDGAIGLDDLAALLSNFACAAPTCPGDLNNDAVVDLTDLAIMLSRFGSTCP